jgi:hypothetical protein
MRVFVVTCRGFMRNGAYIFQCSFNYINHVRLEGNRCPHGAAVEVLPKALWVQPFGAKPKLIAHLAFQRAEMEVGLSR